MTYTITQKKYIAQIVVIVYESYMDEDLANMHTQKYIIACNLEKFNITFHMEMNFSKKVWACD
jgi:hypothetical protein